MQQPVADGVRKRLSSVLAVVLASALFVGSAVAYVALARHYRAEMWRMIDLEVYRWGGEQARHTDALYDARFVDFLSFTYPPFSAVVFMLLTVVSMETLRRIVVLGNLALLAGCVWLVLGMLGERDNLRRAGHSFALAALFVWIEPVQQTLQFGQINLVLMAVLLVDLSQADAARTKGIGVGAAAALKLTPAVFVAYLFVTGRRRATKVAVATFAACTALGAAVLPGESRDYWFGGRFANSSRVGGVAYVGNQSLHGFVDRLLAGRHAEPVFYVLAAVVGVVGLATAALAYRRFGELAGVLACALTGLLASPISWSHHWVWIAAAITVLVWHATARRSLVAGLGAIVVIALTAAWTDRAVSERVPKGLIWRAPPEPSDELRWSLWQSVYGNLYVLAGLVVLGTAFWLLMTRRGAGPRRSGHL